MPFTIDGEWVCSQKNLKENQTVKVRVEKRSGRILTIISHLSDSNIKQIFKDLKGQCHCGGHLQNSQIELQGDHQEKVKIILKQKGLL